MKRGFQTAATIMSGTTLALPAAPIDLTPAVQIVDVYPYPVAGGLSATPAGPDSYRYCGWPANGKMYAWGDELLLVFTYASAAKSEGAGYHATGEDPSYRWSVRSFDGGLTWTDAPSHGAGLIEPRTPHAMVEPIDFSQPDLALMVQMTGSQTGPSHLLYSYDRGRSWRGYHTMDLGDFNPVAARSDYIIEDANTCRIFASAGTEGDEDGTSPHQWITRDGGLNWELLGRTGLEISGQSEWAWSIMPATVRLSDGTLVQTARTKGTGRPFRNFHPVHRSIDGGQTWHHDSTVFRETMGRSGSGLHTPSDLDLIPGTDTLVCTYVDRATPSRMLAKISTDKGLTWGEEIVIRKDGGGHDVGYPETVFRADGKAVTVAYWHRDQDRLSWSPHHNPRFLAFVIWDPRQALKSQSKGRSGRSQRRRQNQPRRSMFGRPLMEPYARASDDRGGAASDTVGAADSSCPFTGMPTPTDAFKPVLKKPTCHPIPERNFPISVPPAGG